MSDSTFSSGIPDMFPGGPEGEWPAMAFHDVRFPLDYAGGTSGGPMYSTRVVSVESGAEQRVQMWTNGRLAFDIGYVANPADMSIVISFFRARKGRAFAFRFRDWSDYKAILEPLVTAPTMQLMKTYGDDVGSELRAITKPCDDGTFQLYDNGASVSSTVDFTTGIVTPTVYNAGHTYSWSGTFDVPVRFDVDKLSYVQDHVGQRTIQSLPIVEVRI